MYWSQLTESQRLRVIAQKGYKHEVCVIIALLYIIHILYQMKLDLDKYYRKSEEFVIGKIDFHEQIKAASTENFPAIDKDNRKVLIIHTGGTIGMFADENNKYVPKRDKFLHFLQSYPYFSDESQTYFISKDGFMITPETIFKKKIWYKFYELDQLIDSTNMSIQRLNMILQAIQKNYDYYDAFVILHGTDTMSFTASSLSFMIENLKKTIVITGSQVPISKARNDATNNLLCALTIAGHYHIPEVLLLFDNTLMRGNRTTKTSSSSFNSFTSPNYYPIGQLGLKIEIKWELVRMCKIDKPTKFTSLNTNVGLVKLTPFGLPVQQKTKYIVIQSYGVGNIPTEGPFHDWLMSNWHRDPKDRMIIVNISQVYQSVILNLYATGNEASVLGLIPGGDMTCEAAVAKLSYLATQNYTYQQIKELIPRNLRGQLTEMEDRQTLNKENYVLSCSTILQKNFLNQSERYKELLLYTVYPKLVSQRQSQAALSHLAQNGFKVDYRFGDGGTLLHQYFKDKKKCSDNRGYLNYLLQSGIDVNARDKRGTTALFYAIENDHLQEARLLFESKQAAMETCCSRAFRAIRKQEYILMRLMIQFGDPFKYKNQEGRNVFMYAIIRNNRQMFEFLKGNLLRDQTDFLQQCDVYGRNTQYYIREAGWSLEDRLQSLQNKIDSINLL